MSRLTLSATPADLSRRSRRLRLSALDTARTLAVAEEWWRTGAIEAVAPTEESPFLLGSIAPGKHQMAIESNMFRSPAVSHAAPVSDFLVIRAASGALSIREVTGSIVVGQQEPLRRVPPPSSKECRWVHSFQPLSSLRQVSDDRAGAEKNDLQLPCLQASWSVEFCRDLEEARMVAYVLRELRRQKLRNEKKKQEVEATITVRDLNEMFPGISDGIIRSRLRDRCNCVPFKVRC